MPVSERQFPALRAIAPVAGTGPCALHVIWAAVDHAMGEDAAIPWAVSLVSVRLWTLEKTQVRYWRLGLPCGRRGTAGMGIELQL